MNSMLIDVILCLNEEVLCSLCPFLVSQLTQVTRLRDDLTRTGEISQEVAGIMAGRCICVV